MPDYRPPVDVDALLVAHFSADVDLVALLGDHISTELGKEMAPPGHRHLLLERIGGGPAQGNDPADHLDAPLIQLSAYGATRGESSDVARAALAALHRAPAATHAGAVVTRIRRVQGPLWLPDLLTDIPRHLTTVFVYLHPTG